MVDEKNEPEKTSPEQPESSKPASASGTPAEPTSAADVPGTVTDEAGTPPPSAIPSAGEVAGADAEKAAMVEQAKSRVEAVKESLSEQTSLAAPKAPVKKKEEGPKPIDASSHPLVEKLRAKFNGAVIEAVEFIGQLSVHVDAARIVEICDFLKRDEQTPFNYLSDLTCVHVPDRVESPFEIVYNLYSIPANERVRLNVAATEDGVETVTGVWPAANWMEREVYDLFGVKFRNHPDLRRLLLPPDWEGHPLRKDVSLEFVENEWTKKHLPEMTQVQFEQLQQRRAYGLELLSVPEERMMREILKGGKEVMPKDK
ncbi:MAG TPA: NADH-quinone oxidoreductase subunit C [Pyrinomonadaceae bacterium]|nr:NADH-quinone oxidoreductase subunit C [Pyrinomonadaceae bacterium]